MLNDLNEIEQPNQVGIMNKKKFQILLVQAKLYKEKWGKYCAILQ